MAFPVRIGIKDNIESASDFGPHLIGGAWYAVNKEASGSCDVYKSLDNGATWVVQDPLDLNAGEAFSIVWDLPNGLIYALRNKGITTTGLLTIFDTSTDTWQPIGADGPTLDAATLTDTFLARMVQVASGDIWVFYLNKISAAPLEVEIDYVVNSGGVWGVPGVLVAATPGPISNYLQAAVVDSGNLIHVFYKQNATGVQNIGDLSHVSITTGEVISGPTTISTVANYSSAGHPSIFGTSILLPYFDSNRLAGVWAGTPLAVPVWTFTLVDTNSLGAGVIDDGFGTLQGTTAYSFVDSGVAYLLWQSTNDDASYAINRIYYAKNSGSGWSGPALLYDEVTDPATWIGTNPPDLYSISANVIAGNVLALANVNCEGVAFVGTQSTTITIDCGSPPDGAIGIPYSHTFPVSGDVPPDTFSISAGSLPAGLSLDASTGAVTGTPTGPAGSSGFTVQVTDSTDASATVDCSINIGSYTILCNNPPVGIVGTFYTHDFPVEGGIPPFTFALTAGTLPPGLVLDGNTGNISGTPTINGIFLFTIQVTDSNDNTAEVECSITIKKRCLLVQVEGA